LVAPDPPSPDQAAGGPDVGRPSLLEVRGLTAGYKGRMVIHELDLDVMPSEVVGVFGSNGAGKTTTLKAILGLLPRVAGTVAYRGSQWRPGRSWRAAAEGMAFIPAERFTFAGLSVEENLRLGATSVAGGSSQQTLDGVLAMFPILRERRNQKAGTMSGGEQRMLSLAVALMSQPRLLMLDEPSLGLAPRVVDQLIATLRGLVEEQGVSVIMVEQNVNQAVRITDRAYVLRSGRIIQQMSGDEARSRDEWWDLF
jgi:branched-chain amino acid transport system ATP-binding protein